MTNPFATSVGLKGVSPDSPAPVILINDISGITAELVTALKTTDTAAAAEEWGKVQRLGLEKLTSLVQEQLSKSADFQYVMAQSTVWTPKDAPAVVTVFSQLQGCRYTMPYAPYQQLVIEGLFAQISAAATVPVTVIDLKRGVVLATATVSRAAGEVGFTGLENFTFPVGLTGLDVYVGINATGLILTELGGAAGDMTGDGVTMTTGTQIVGNLTPSGFAASDTRVWFPASVKNDLSAVVARYADRLQWAYAYVCGSLLMREKLASPNFNLYTNTNRLFTEDQESKLMEEARSRIKPVGLDMLKELAQSKAATPKRDRPFEPGYQTQSFVDESVFWNPVTGYGGYSGYM